MFVAESRHEHYGYKLRKVYLQVEDVASRCNPQIHPSRSRHSQSDQSINPHSSTIILDSFPPQAFFNKSWNPVIIPFLKFLHSTNSPFLLNVYPDFVYLQSNGLYR
ncbi:hypothetical protein YC2023_107200 [Brassica napus]